jgi:hypothetical protein
VESSGAHDIDGPCHPAPGPGIEPISLPGEPLGGCNGMLPRRLRGVANAPIIRALADGAHDSARISEIPAMSSLFISTID